MITKDCRTFFAAKTQSSTTHQMIISGEIGGGNLLCAIGLFSLLNLVSKVYLLTKDFDHYLTPGSTGVRDGQVNETDAFSELVEYLQTSGVDLGLAVDKTSNKDVWRRIRSELTHMSWPDAAISSFQSSGTMHGNSLNYLEESLKGFATPFLDHPDYGTTCNVDRLYLMIPDVIETVSTAIDSAEEKNVTKTYKWIGGLT